LRRPARLRDWFINEGEGSMRASIHSAVGGICLVGFTFGCGSEPIGEPEDGVGSLRAAIELGPRTHDVTQVRFDLVSAESDCDALPAATLTVPLEAELSPASVSGEGAAHHFASGLFTVAPGSYRACATPLRADSAASEECAPTSDLTTVVAEQAAELTLVSQCQGTPAGGLEVTVGLNDPPQITGLTVTESTFITICESANISVTAEDPNDDALSYAWSVVSGPDGGRLRASEATATFSGAPGDYVLRVTASDAHAAEASLLFTVHVADATCFVPSEIQGIFASQCSPCHTTGSSGGLKLAPADVAYGSLVGQSVGSAACAGQTRVVPGDAANSYLVAKLRGAPGICGVAMPRNRPALPEEQIQSIEAWINALPH
jgi:mono/diheme cytochrome c family protein